MVEIATDAGSILNAASGALLVALGVFVASVKPRASGNVAFAAFAVTFGTGVLLLNVFLQEILQGTAAGTLVAWVSLGSIVASAGFAARVATRFPHPLAPGDRPALALALAIGVLYVAVASFLAVPAVTALAPRNPIVGSVAHYAAAVLAYVAVTGALTFLLVMSALRYRRESDPVARRQFLLMSAALVPYVGFVAGAGTTDGSPTFVGPPELVATAAVSIAIVTVLAALWLRNANEGPEAAACRNLALLALGAALAGLLWARLDGPTGPRGFLRTLGVLVFAYAILRMQLLGIDVKVRWGISRGTIAAAFIAVFFVASEAAQVVFGGEENPYVGIAAAGLLVFAIAPLQRAADRLAQAAVPGDDLRRAAGKEDAFRTAARFALRDHRLSTEEELALAHLSDELGLSHRRALELRNEVEADLAAKRPTAGRSRS
ncbi:MAG TPA: hypothetical protein VM681_10790 [Candidatus Thermoplasmatota archaeon]|nr:hypothetical protein [Candidatus Thermoplasmatota archaeon]